MTQAHRRSPRSAPPPVRVLIVDDHVLARTGMRMLLAGARRLEIVGEAADGRDALILCRRLRPDLVLMDVRLPDMDGLSATRAIRNAQPEYASEALRAGAAGYLLKGASRGEVLAALKRALAAKPKPPID